MPAALLELDEVHKTFRGRAGRAVHASRGVSLHVAPGEVLGLVGESGSGKSTVANLALGLIAPDTGDVRFAGRSLLRASRRERRAMRARVQAVFQEPLLALDGRRTVGWSIAEPLRIHGRGDGPALERRVRGLLDDVGLDASLSTRRPSELSGGQLQRVNIARALALEPELLVCDEPVSALDVSVQAQIVNLLLRIGQERGLALLLISHDLAVVRHLADRIAVMYAGRIVEEGPTDAVCDDPAHPYTGALLDACLDPQTVADAAPPRVPAAVPDRAVLPPTGCRFAPRCPVAIDACTAEDPPLTGVGTDHRSACLRAGVTTI